MASPKEPVGTLITCSSLLPEIKKLKKKKKKIVWTNGCFDILHAGHVLLLNQAKALGDILIVGMNSDSSARKLKGPGRPVNNARKRSYVLCGLRAVDYVISFSGKSPLNIIKKLKPDIYVKGGDYSLDSVNQLERTAVESYGGKALTVGLEKNLSTTAIIKEINTSKKS
ncbi:MAG: D-glycero-beta-D-manno-heptose 1-phosphate adenylyltransferase [Planctomycetota bacterium]|jgi:D-beta-D-heptose 7-phosphate kinase/D-beta-D-heptose 1-phosphate adenosyltransferase